MQNVSEKRRRNQSNSCNKKIRIEIPIHPGTSPQNPAKTKKSPFPSPTTNPISSIMAATFHFHNPFSSSPSPVSATAARSISHLQDSNRRRREEERSSVIYEGGVGWWTLAPRARLVYDKDPKILGFRCGYKCLSMGSKRSNSNSSEKRGGVFGSGSASDSASPPFAASEFVADMSSETKDHNNAWFQDDFHTQTHSPSMHPHEPQRSKLLTLPTILTLARVAAVPILVCTFYVDNWRGTTATTSIFIAAAVTDWLDGYIARKMRLGSAFGAFLDPVADKLMVAATLILLCTQPLEVSVFGHVPWLLTIPSIAIIGREITMSAVREWAASQNSKLSEAVAVNNLGKWKTATQMIALTTLLASRDSSLGGGSGIVVATGVVLLYISAWLALWSLFVYSRKISKVLLR